MQGSRTYSPAAKLLHWTVAVLILVQFAVAWLMPHIGRNTTPETLINLHFSLGVAILFVAVIRLVNRLMNATPKAPANTPSWLQIATAGSHWLIYALLIVLPILGWLNASWRGFQVMFFGITMPKLLETHASGWNWTGDIHAALANYGFLTLIAVHICAALYHHIVFRDDVLVSMMPAGHASK